MKVFSKEKYIADSGRDFRCDNPASWVNTCDGKEVSFENETLGRCNGFFISIDWCVDKRPSQTDRIYQYMQDHGSITQMDALREFGCMRLASRICDLKRRGINVKSKIITKRNTYGETVKYAEYYIENVG